VKIKTILKNIKEVADREFNCKSIILNKYYYDSYDLLFIQLSNRNIRIRKGWNGSNNSITIVTKYLDGNGFEQEGYSSDVYAEKIDINIVVSQIIETIREHSTIEERLKLWDIYYSYEARSGKFNLSGGYKYRIEDNKLVYESNENTNVDIKRFLCDYFENLKLSK